MYAPALFIASPPIDSIKSFLHHSTLIYSDPATIRRFFFFFFFRKNREEAWIFKDSTSLSAFLHQRNRLPLLLPFSLRRRVGCSAEQQPSLHDKTITLALRAWLQTSAELPIRDEEGIREREEKEREREKSRTVARKWAIAIWIKHTPA